MKPSSQFPKLPSLAELLKHPAVERVMDRVNQTTVAQRATGFLQELRNHLQDRPEHGIVPTIHELAERLARRILGQAHQGKQIINATGVVWGQRWSHPPLAEAALHEMVQSAAEYGDSHEPRMEQTTRLLIELSGAEAAWITSSFAGAVRLAEETGIGQLDATQYAGLKDPAEFELTPVATLPDRLQSGIDLVIADGAGLIGGPEAGIVVGRKQKIESLMQMPLAGVIAADRLTLAALEATLRLYRRPERVIHDVPILQLLSTPLENLELRCARIATLLAESELISVAEPTHCESPWLDSPAAKFAGSSWAIKVEPSAGNRERLALRMQDAPQQIVAREVGDSWWIDLRAVFPRWDQQLVSVFQSPSATED